MPRTRSKSGNINVVLDELYYLYIDGLLSFVNFALPLHGGLCVIVGPNDVGKTGIIRALELFDKYSSASRSPSIPAGMFSKIKGVRNNRIEICLVYKGRISRGEDSNILLNRQVERHYNGNEDFIGSCIIIEPKNNNISPSEFGYWDNIATTTTRMLCEFKVSEDNGNIIIEKIDETCENISSKDMERYKLPIFIFGSYRELSEEYKSSGLLGKIASNIISKLRQEDEDLRQRIDELKKIIQERVSERVEKYTQTIMEIYGEDELGGKIKPIVSDIDLGKAVAWELYVDDKSLNDKIPLSSKGQGIQNIVYIELIRQIQEEKLGGETKRIILAVDEPENHLHPRLLHKLHKSLIDLSRNNNYVIVITHSPIIINNSKPNQIYYMSKDSNGQSKIKPLVYGELEQILQELGVTLADILGANVILIVEGNSDRMFFEKILVKEYYLPVKVIVARGANETPRLAAAFYTITKRYTKGKIIIVVDNDKYNEVRKKIEKYMKERFSKEHDGSTKPQVLKVYDTDQANDYSLEDLYKKEYIIRTIKNSKKLIDRIQGKITRLLEELGIDEEKKQEYFNTIVEKIKEKINEIEHPYAKNIEKLIRNTITEIIRTNRKRDISKIGETSREITEIIKDELSRNITENDINGHGRSLIERIKEIADTSI